MFIEAISKVNSKSVELHNRRGDFENWARHSLRSETLANDFQKIRYSEHDGESLKKAISQIAERHFIDLEQKAYALGYY